MDGTYGLIPTGEGDDPLLTKVRVVELGSLAVVSELRLPPELGFLDEHAEFSPDGEIIAAPLFDTGLDAVGIGLWSVATGRLMATLGHLDTTSGPSNPDPAKWPEVHFSPDGTRVVTLTGDGTVRIWLRPDVQ